MTIANWVAIGTALFLGTIALIAPWISEIIKRRWFRPNLKINFAEEPPYCHLTTFGGRYRVYYFRLKVTNIGKTQATRCEVTVDELHVLVPNRGYVMEENFSPVNLCWSSRPENFFLKQYTDINPEREMYCDLGHLSEQGCQSDPNSTDYKVTRQGDYNKLKFFLELILVPYSQPSYFLKGSYRIKVSVHSENAERTHCYFRIDWSGIWRDTEKEQFKELVIEKG